MRAWLLGNNLGLVITMKLSQQELFVLRVPVSLPMRQRLIVVTCLQYFIHGLFFQSSNITCMFSGCP